MPLFLALSVASVVTSAPVKLIIDTDIGGGGCRDVDDVAAIGVGHALADRGEAELLAIVHNTSPLQCAGHSEHHVQRVAMGGEVCAPLAGDLTVWNVCLLLL